MFASKFQNDQFQAEIYKENESMVYKDALFLEKGTLNYSLWLCINLFFLRSNIK